LNDYIAKPNDETDKGVLVLHAWWGLNDFFKSWCDRLAEVDFVTLAPDLYHGRTAATIPDAEKLRATLKQAEAIQEVNEAADKLQSMLSGNRKEIGVIGFSMGGRWGLGLAEQRPDLVRATVVVYGSRGGDYAGSQSAFQFHLAETDPYVADSGIKKLEKALAKAGKYAEFYRYPGTVHWFCEDDRPDAYDPRAAALAWERMLAFLYKHL
jgi:carboxymethylenebutenolidase